jgi:hypothetical protein
LVDMIGMLFRMRTSSKRHSWYTRLHSLKVVSCWMIPRILLLKFMIQWKLV